MTAFLYLLLAVVALAAAVLSFDALHGLALLCGYAPALAPLLPVTVDAGAAAGTLAWLARTGTARRFGRVLALVLLAGSVAGNALGHGLDAYGARPAWWVVVAVSAVPPAVLAATVHLAVLARRPAAVVEDQAAAAEPIEIRHMNEVDDVPPDWWADAPATDLPPDVRDDPPTQRDDSAPTADDRAVELIAAGTGRRRLARELGVSEHQARDLIAAHRSNGEVPR